jgi:hypothetical protein
MAVFPHTMMCLNHCIGSLDPLHIDKDRWRQILSEYQIDGRRVFELESASSRSDLEAVLKLADNESDPPSASATERWWLVSRARMEKLWGAATPITDDNLGHEYHALTQ